MGLIVYNSLTRKKEPFEPVHPGKVGIYLCGPTVYKPSHIGHAVGPIIFDAIKRYLVHCGYEVTWVVNITDVDDKLIVEAAAQGISTVTLAERISRDYVEAMATLHVDGIDLMPKASEHIGDIISIIQTLIDREVAYASNGDVYFDVTRDDDYGKLSNRRIEQQEGQRELQSGQKRNPGDFALWKAAKPDEPEEVKFDSPWGKGRPGWHIECSAMAMRYLGDTFDIHGGGLDLIFPHHENEIAQSESATGKPFAKIWMHNGLTRVNTKKVSKSDASPEMQAALTKMTLRNLLAEYPGELIRFFVLSTHYRRPIEYSDEEIESKRKGLSTFYRLFERVERLCGKTPYEDVPAELSDSARANSIRQRESLPSPDAQPSESLSPPEPQALACANVQSSELIGACKDAGDAFHRAMNDDFNTAGAIAALFDFAAAINRFIEQEKLESPGGVPEPQASAGANDSVRRKSLPFPNAQQRESLPSPEPQASACANPRTDALAATRFLIALARLIGVFLEPIEKKSTGDDGVTDAVMQILIQIRQHVRGKKDFETADMIRDLLKERNIALEDRPDGTIWRLE